MYRKKLKVFTLLVSLLTSGYCGADQKPTDKIKTIEQAGNAKNSVGPQKQDTTSEKNNTVKKRKGKSRKKRRQTRKKHKRNIKSFLLGFGAGAVSGIVFILGLFVAVVAHSYVRPVR